MSAQPNTAPASIGSAFMRPDGTLELLLRATDGGGLVGDARLVYPPAHPKYGEILKHLGEMKPGDTRPVPPWE